MSQTPDERIRAVLQQALPLLRAGLREIVEAGSERAEDRVHFIRDTLSPDDIAWVAPWRAAVLAVEEALGLSPSSDDGGVRYVANTNGDSDEAL